MQNPGCLENKRKEKKKISLTNVLLSQYLTARIISFPEIIISFIQFFQCLALAVEGATLTLVTCLVKNVLRVVLKIYDKKGVISYFIWTSSTQGHRKEEIVSWVEIKHWKDIDLHSNKRVSDTILLGFLLKFRWLFYLIIFFFKFFPFNIFFCKCIIPFPTETSR